MPPERYPAAMRLRGAAPSRQAAGARKQALSAPACAMPIVLPRLSLHPARGANLRHNRSQGITWPRDRRKYDREPENGAKQEQHRRDPGETNRIRVKRRLIDIRDAGGA